MLLRRASNIRSSEITDERTYLSRREFAKTLSGAVLGPLAGAAAAALSSHPALAQAPLTDTVRSPLSTSEPTTPFEYVTGYNNFYEFGFDKEDPSRHAGKMRIKPWTVKVEGQMKGHTTEYHLEDLLKPHALEERIYRLRCVEGWSMIIPWVGFPLADLINRFEPTSQARFVEFRTLYRPSEMPRQVGASPLFSSEREPQGRLTTSDRSRLLEQTLEWPYTEALRMDEARHPLTILAVGLYGKSLLNQNGAPLRLVVPWKYGFKSIKSIVNLRFTKSQPKTTWSAASPGEFGFYANVNPDVARPQSQKTERRIGRFFRQPSLPFNGYADQVAHMYAGMDLNANF